MSFAYIALRTYADPDGEPSTGFHGAHSTAIGAWQLATNGSDHSYHGGHDTAIDAMLEKWDTSTGTLVATFAPNDDETIVAAKAAYDAAVDASRDGVSAYIKNDTAVTAALAAWRTVENAMRADPAYAAAAKAENDAEIADRNNPQKFSSKGVDTYAALTRARRAAADARRAAPQSADWYAAETAYNTALNAARVTYQNEIHAVNYAAARATLNAAVTAAVATALATF